MDDLEADLEAEGRAREREAIARETEEKAHWRERVQLAADQTRIEQQLKYFKHGEQCPVCGDCHDDDNPAPRSCITGDGE